MRYDANATLIDVGIVAVVHGSATGLGPGRVTWLWEDQLFGPGRSETGDHLGAALADLAIGAPDRDDAGADVGGAAVIFGSLFADDFESGGLRLWSAAEP